MQFSLKSFLVSAQQKIVDFLTLTIGKCWRSELSIVQGKNRRNCITPLLYDNCFPLPSVLMITIGSDCVYNNVMPAVINDQNQFQNPFVNSFSCNCLHDYRLVR